MHIRQSAIRRSTFVRNSPFVYAAHWPKLHRENHNENDDYLAGVRSRSYYPCPVHEVSGPHFMERFVHKGVVFFVEPNHEEGFYSFRFVLNKKTVRGKTRTRLLGTAIRRVKHVIERRLRSL
jgi:hypothetical protein